MKFFEAASYLYKSTIRPCVEYRCHVWTAAPSCYVDKLQIQVCITVVPSFAASLEPLGHRGNVARVSFFCMDYFGKCRSEVAELCPLHCSLGGSLVILIDCMIFYVTVPRC